MAFTHLLTKAHNPSKKANVIDCIRIPEGEGDSEDLNGDQERSLWLQELSEVKREE